MLFLHCYAFQRVKESSGMKFQVRCTQGKDAALRLASDNSKAAKVIEQVLKERVKKSRYSMKTLFSL